MKHRRLALVLKLPDLLALFYELLKYLQQISGKYYLSNGTGKLNIPKLIKLFRAVNLEDKLKKMCMELGYKTSDRGLAACLKQVISFLSEYSVGIYLLEQKIREEEVLTPDTLKMILEELSYDIAWYREELRKLNANTY